MSDDGLDDSATPSEVRQRADGGYGPFDRGRFPVAVRTIEVTDLASDRRFPCEIWYPTTAENAGRDLEPEHQDSFAVQMPDSPHRQAALRDVEVEPGSWPLVAFSHSSGGERRQSTYLCTHLSSHGYVVAAPGVDGFVHGS